MWAAVRRDMFKTRHLDLGGMERGITIYTFVDRHFDGSARRGPSGGVPGRGRGREGKGHSIRPGKSRCVAARTRSRS